MVESERSYAKTSNLTLNLSENILYHFYYYYGPLQYNVLGATPEMVVDGAGEGLPRERTEDTL